MIRRPLYILRMHACTHVLVSIVGFTLCMLHTQQLPMHIPCGTSTVEGSLVDPLHLIQLTYSNHRFAYITLYMQCYPMVGLINIVSQHSGVTRVLRLYVINSMLGSCAVEQYACAHIVYPHGTTPTRSPSTLRIQYFAYWNDPLVSFMPCYRHYQHSLQRYPSLTVRAD